MEKILFNRSGQWTLSKAWGDPDYEQVSHVNSPFKDPVSASKAKVDYVKNLKNDNENQYKNMKNLQSGQDELHILLHRGMSSEAGVRPNATGPNMLDFSNGKTVKTTHNSINTLSQDEASGYGHEGHHVSFWVPISNIHGLSTDINNHLNPNGYSLRAGEVARPYPTDPHHTMIAPGEFRMHDSHSWKKD